MNFKIAFPFEAVLRKFRLINIKRSKATTLCRQEPVNPLVNTITPEPCGPKVNTTTPHHQNTETHLQKCSPNQASSRRLLVRVKLGGPTETDSSRILLQASSVNTSRCNINSISHWKSPSGMAGRGQMELQRWHLESKIPLLVFGKPVVNVNGGKIRLPVVIPAVSCHGGAYKKLNWVLPPVFCSLHLLSPWWCL